MTFARARNSSECSFYSVLCMTSAGAALCENCADTPYLLPRLNARNSTEIFCPIPARHPTCSATTLTQIRKSSLLKDFSKLNVDAGSSDFVTQSSL